MSRPIGVTILAILYFLGAGLLLLAGLAVALGMGALGMSSSSGQAGAAGGAFLAGLGVGLAVVFFLIAAINGAMGWGLWKLKNWARIVIIALAALTLAGIVVEFSKTMTDRQPSTLVVTLVRAAVGVLVLWYLLRARVKAAFKPAAAPVAAGN